MAHEVFFKKIKLNTMFVKSMTTAFDLKNKVYLASLNSAPILRHKLLINNTL